MVEHGERSFHGIRYVLSHYRTEHLNGLLLLYGNGREEILPIWHQRRHQRVSASD